MVSCGLVYCNDCAAIPPGYILRNGAPRLFKLRHIQSRQPEPWFRSCALLLSCFVTLAWPSQLASRALGGGLIRGSIGSDPGRKGECWKRLCFMHLLGRGSPQGTGGPREGHQASSFPLVGRRVRKRTRTSSCIFMLRPQHSAPQSQLTEAGRLLRGGLTPPSSRHSTIVQSGIGPRKLGACKTAMNFAKQL